MNARDELAGIINTALGVVTGIFDTTDDENRGLADAILAAGYRKPRTINTTDELDALPVGSVVILRDSKRDLHPAQKGERGWSLPFANTSWTAETLLAGSNSVESAA